MVFPWFSYGFPMVFPWFSYGFPMVKPWLKLDALDAEFQHLKSGEIRGPKSCVDRFSKSARLNGHGMSSINTGWWLVFFMPIIVVIYGFMMGLYIYIDITYLVGGFNLPTPL